MKSHISLSILRAVVGITLLSYPHILEAMPREKDGRAERAPVSRVARQEEFLDVVENYMDIPSDAAQSVAHEREFIHYKGKGYSDKKALYLRERDIMLTLIRSPKPRFQSAWKERQAQFTNFFLRVFEMFGHFQNTVYDTQGLPAEEARAIRRTSYPLHVHPHLLYLQRDLINPFFAKLATIGIISPEDPHGIIPVNDGCFLGFQKDRTGNYLPFAGRTDGPYRLYRMHYGLENVVGEQTAFLIGHGGTLLTDKGFYIDRMGFFSDDLRMQVYNGVNSPSPFTLHQRTLRLRERQQDLSHPLARKDKPLVLVPALSQGLTDDMHAPEASQASSLSPSLLTVSEKDGVVADDRGSFFETKAIPLAAKQEGEAFSADATSSTPFFAEEERGDLGDSASLSDSLPVNLLSAASDSSHSTSQEETSGARILTGEAELHSVRVIRSMLLEEESRGENALFIPLPTTAQEAAYVELLLLEGDEGEEEFMARESAPTRLPSLFLESTRDSRGELVSLLPTAPAATAEASDAVVEADAAVDEPAVSRPEHLRERLLAEIITEISPPKASVTPKQRNKGRKDKPQKHSRQKEAVATSAEADDTAARISALRNDAQRILRSRLAHTKLKYDKLLKLLNGIKSEIGHSATRHGLESEATAHVVTNGSHNVFHDDRGAFLIARPHGGGDFQYPPHVANRLLERWTESFLTTIERRATADSSSTPPVSKFGGRHGNA